MSPSLTTVPRLTTLILLSALAILPLNIFLPSLGGMAAEFGVDYSVMSFSLAVYAGVSACLQILLAPLSDRFGRRPVVLWSVGIFIGATIGCIFAPNAATFLMFRTIQAVVAPTFGVALASIRDTTGREQAASKMGYVAMAWAVAPMLAPSIGGLLDESFGWRASFWLMAILGSGVFAVCVVDLHETNQHPSKSLVGQYRSYPELLGSKKFWAYALCMAFSVGAFYAFLAGAPLVAGAEFGLAPALLGIAMGSITGGFMVGSFLTARLSSRLGQMRVLIGGRLIACFGMLLGLVLFGLGVNHPLALFGPCLFVGMANGLTMPISNAGAISVRQGLSGSAAGLAGAITVAGGAAMSLVTGGVLSAENARPALLLVMLASATFALAAGYTAKKLEAAMNNGH